MSTGPITVKEHHALSLRLIKALLLISHKPYKPIRITIYHVFVMHYISMSNELAQGHLNNLHIDGSDHVCLEKLLAHSETSS